MQVVLKRKWNEHKSHRKTKEIHKQDIHIALEKWGPTHLDDREYPSLLQVVWNETSMTRT